MLTALLVGLLTPVLVVTTSTQASANSAVGLANNAWIITELGSSVMSNDAQWATLSTGEKALATTATGTAVATTGLGTQPKAGGKLGMVLNTVAVLGGLVSLWPGGDDAPELPVPAPTGETATGFCGGAFWTTSPYVSGATCASTSVSLTFNNFASTALGSGQAMWGIRNDTTGVYDGNTSFPGPDRIWSGSATSGVLSRSAAPFTYALHRFTSSGLTVGQNVATGTPLGTMWVAATGATLANPSPGTETDPALLPRYIDSTANCRTPGGGSTPVTHRHGPFTFDPALAASLPEVPDLTCPTGTFLESGTRTLHTEGTPAGDDVALVEPYVAPAWVEDQMVRFPDCYPATTTMCVLKVERLTPAPVVDCHAFAVGSANPCAAWWTDPQRSTRYDCKFGETSVAMRRCSPYADTFSTGAVAPSDPDPDAEIGDPTPGVDPTPEATPDLGDCVPNWGLELLNPWWVFKAQACALKWAFVPTEAGLGGSFDGVRQVIDASNLTAWMDTVQGGITGAMREGTGGCLGPPVSWEYFDRMGLPNPWYPASACDEPVATAAQWCRLLLTAIVGVGGLLKVAQMLSVSIGLSKDKDAISLGGGR